MFRELTRKEQKLPAEEALSLLRRETRGILAVQGEGGYPYAMPMNHYYHGEDGCLYFHSGLTGHRTDALQSCDKVCFCCTEQGEKRPGDWFYTVRSVVVFGRMQLVRDPDTVRRITTLLSYKFTKDETYIEGEIRAALDHTLLLRLVPEDICGKKVTER